MLKELNEYIYYGDDNRQMLDINPDNLWDIINTQPTAYNVEKVIEQIHAYFCKETDARTDGLEEYPSGLISDLLKYNKEICEIVRKGGV